MPGLYNASGLVVPNATAISHNDPLSLLTEQELLSSDYTVLFINDSTLIKSLPHLYNLKDANLTIHVIVSDYQNIISLQDLGLPLFISHDSQQLSSIVSLSQIYSKTILNFIDIPNVEDVLSSLELSSSSDEEKLDNLEDALIKSNIEPFQYRFSTSYFKSSINDTAIVHLGSFFEELASLNLPTISINQVYPLRLKEILVSLPSSVKNLILIEQSNTKLNSKFSNFLLQFFQSPNLLTDQGIEKITSSSISNSFKGDFNQVLKIVLANISQSNPIQNLFFGEEAQPSTEQDKDITSIKNSEQSSYYNILNQLFGQQTNIINSPDSLEISKNPEYGFGSYLYHQEKQQELINLVHSSINANEFSTLEPTKLIELLSNWLINIRDDSDKDNTPIVKDILTILSKDSSEISLKLQKLSKYFYKKSHWLISSDHWSYDLGSSGFHQVLQSESNINLLIIDNETYESKQESTKKLINRKKDIGLYAMNYGNAYVGSIAIYHSYTHVLTTLIEASKFNGPSIILAYLPSESANDTPLDFLKQTKLSIDSGFIPLYRYNPSLSEDEQFKLDSTVIKKQLQEFLDKENKLTLISKKNPQFARDLAASQTSNIKSKQDQKAKQAYDELLNGLSGAPLSIYFASDGGSAESLAKKLHKRALQRGLKGKISSMDEIDLDVLPTEENIVFITSTSGQGEFPQNGKNFWDSIKNSGDLDLEFSKISSFGLGDSLYWPREQDKHYYNKPAKDLYERLLFLNAKELIPLGLGDDQDADGYQTNYKPWEEALWKALGVDDVQTADEPPPITNEDIKIASNYLRGTIAEGLKDDSTGAIASSDQQLTKFHGIYMQDDRDLRDARKAAGLEPFYIFMARVRLPGGVTSAKQWLVLDKLADERGNGTIKLTTRATYQLHGIVKHNLKPSIRAMNSELMDTLGACGDVNRNVMISALPGNAKIHSQIENTAKRISEHLLPQTTAYHEIWLKGDDPEDDDPTWPETFNERKDGPKKLLVAGNAIVDNEPFYGPTYLPRKYKINITVPPYNDVDVYSSDVGLIAILEDNEVIGFNVLVGGGMGSTHNNKKTYPRAGSLFGFVEVDKVHLVCEKIMLVQRDFGNRKDRKNARLKYTVDNLGVELYKSKVEELLGFPFKPAKEFEIKDNTDHFGWVTDETGLNHFTCFIENGRVEDTPELPQKRGLKKIAEFFRDTNSPKGTFRLTGNQHVLISGVSEVELPTIKQLLHDYKLDNIDFSALRLSSAACVAFPTCGLAMAESERYLPVLITKLEEALEEYGLRHDSIVMRMTGCPNGCARPWLAEIALVGKAYGVYNLMLGGGFHGQRLNKIFKQSIKEDEVLSILKPLFKRWALEREVGEHFGDFVVRVGVIKPTLEGKYFHDDIPEQV